MELKLCKCAPWMADRSANRAAQASCQLSELNYYINSALQVTEASKK